MSSHKPFFLTDCIVNIASTWKASYVALLSYLLPPVSFLTPSPAFLMLCTFVLRLRCRFFKATVSFSVFLFPQPYPRAFYFAFVTTTTIIIIILFMFAFLSSFFSFYVSTIISHGHMSSEKRPQFSEISSIVFFLFLNLTVQFRVQEFLSLLPLFSTLQPFTCY
jgi:hypothetical protein